MAAPDRLTSILGRAAASRMDPEAVKARGWRESGILVVAISDPRLSEADRADIRRLAEKLYGGA